MKEQDTQAALDALARLEDILGETYIGSDFDTIRAALTAQLTKTDDNVSCPNIANMGDINTELLKALKEAWSVVSSINYGKNHVIKRSDGEVLYGQTDEWCMWALKEVLPKMEQAIARAEQKVGV